MSTPAKPIHEEFADIIATVPPEEFAKLSTRADLDAITVTIAQDRADECAGPSLLRACDQRESLLAEVRRLEEKLGDAVSKWTNYEQKYILPIFAWADKSGFDLRQAVKNNAGKNCVELFFEHVVAERDALAAKLAAAQDMLAVWADEKGFGAERKAAALLAEQGFKS